MSANVDMRGVLGRINRAATLVQLRMRLARVLGITPVVVPIALLLVAAALATHKVFPDVLNERQAWTAFFCIAGAAVASWICAAAWPLAPNAGTLALDKEHKLEGRLTIALEFAAIPADQRTPLMQAAIDEACQFVDKRPRKQTLRAAVAAPLFAAAVVSWWLFPLLLGSSGGMLVLVAAFEIRTPIPVQEVAPVSTIVPVELTDDDLDAFRDASKEMERPQQSPEMKAAIERFNRLIEDLAAKRLDRDDAFNEMEALERELMKNADADQKRLAEELKETAKQLEKSDLAKDLAEALKKDDLKKAEQEMKKLAAKLQDKKSPVDKAQLKKLRDAMKKAAERRKELQAAIDAKRAEMKEDLLKKKAQVEQQTDPKKKEEEEQLLKKKERELERLDRESQAQAQVNRQLERLDRELAQAAADLMKELNISPEDMQKAVEELQKAAEDLNRLERESMTEKDKEELKKKLEELRELIRQQNKGDKKRMSRMVKFSKRARGGKPGQSGEPEDGDGEEDGEDGKGKKPGDKPGDGDGEGEDGPEGGKGKKGKKGKGQGDGEGDIELSIGPGGAPIPMPGQGDGPGGEQPGPGGGKGGKEAGTGSGGPIAGNRTDPKFDTSSVQQEGLETNSGATKSQVILSAAEKGFRGADYEKVFKLYKTHAEENINQESIPDGYRFYVQRYFQLIRPRD